MKRIIIVIILAVITKIGLAQISFNKIYTFPNSFRNSVSNIFLKGNQYYLIGEIIDSASIVDSPMILFIDSLGTIVSKNVYLLDTNMMHTSLWTSFEPNFNKNAIFISGCYGTANTSTSFFLINLDSLLNVKSRSYIASDGYPFIWPFVTKQLQDNNFISAGFKEHNQNFVRSFVVKTDTSGNKNWLKYYDFEPGRRSSLYQMAYYSDSTNYLFSGITEASESNDLTNGFIISTDTAGNFRWKHSYNKSWYDSQLLIKNDPTCDTIIIGLQTYALGNYDPAVPNYIGNGDVRILKIHANNGNLLWEKTFNICKEKILPARLLVQQNGDIIVCGYYSNYNGSDSAWAAKINKVGDLIWLKAYNYTAFNFGIQHFADVKETKDGGYIFNGIVSIPESYGRSACWVVKTDSMGNAPGCVAITVGINAINKEYFKLKQLKVYPNPADNFFSFEYDLTSTELPLLLKISDITGRIIEEKSLKNKKDFITVICSHFAKGTYNCSIFEGMKLKQSAKIVIE